MEIIGERRLSLISEQNLTLASPCKGGFTHKMSELLNSGVKNSTKEDHIEATRCKY